MFSLVCARYGEAGGTHHALDLARDSPGDRDRRRRIARKTIRATRSTTSGVAGKLLLTQEDVPDAISVEDVADLTTQSNCSPVTKPEGRLSTFADSYAVREIEVEAPEGAATVFVGIYEGLSAATRRMMIFANLDQGIEICARDSPHEYGEGFAETMTPLDGLPDGALGYTSRFLNDGTPEIFERAFTVIDGRVVVVGAQHVGDDEATGVDIHELLAAAIEKVEQVANTPGSA